MASSQIYSNLTSIDVLVDVQGNSMPKIAKELTALSVSKIKKDGRHAVGGVSGLSLKVAGNSRSWVLNMLMGTRTNKEGKEVPNRLFLGLVSALAEARGKARELRNEIKAGIDPLEAKKERKEEAIRQQARNKTFSELAQ